MATDFGSRLARLRQARGLTQAQLAQTLGISTRVLSYYENHATTAAGHLAVRMAQALGVGAEELIGAKPLPKAALAAQAPGAEDLRLWRQFQRLRRLPTKDQRAVLRLLNSLAGPHGHAA